MNKSVIFIVCITHMVTIGTLYLSLPVLLPEIEASLGLETGQSAYAWATLPLASALAVIPGGLLVDRFGERLIGALAVFAASTLGCARYFVGSFGSLELVLALYGAFSAVAYVCLPGLISQHFSGRANSIVQGLSFVAYGVGGIVATVISVPLSDALGGWRTASLCFGLASFLVGCTWLYFLPKNKVLTKQSSSIRATFLLVKQKPILWMCISYAAFTGGYLGFAGLYVLHLSNAGWDSESSTVLMATAQVAFLIGAAFLPGLADTFFARTPTYTVSMFTVGALMVIVWLLAIKGAEYFILSWVLLALMGFLMGSVGIYFAMLTEQFGIPANALGTAIGFVTFGSYLGGAVFPWFAGATAGFGPLWSGLAFGIGGYGVAGISVLLAVRAARSLAQPQL